MSVGRAMPVVYFAIQLQPGVTEPAGLSARLEPVVPFLLDERWSQISAGTSLRAWIKDPSLWPSRCWAETEGAGAAIAGCGFDEAGGALDAADVMRLDTGAWERFEGEWSGCSIGPSVMTALSSSAGTEHVYYLHAKGFTAVSNRARLLWEAMRAFQIAVE